MRKKFYTLSLAALCAASLPLFAEKFTVEKFDGGSTQKADKSFAIKSGLHTFSKDIIPVKDLTKETVITIDLKAAADAPASTSYYVGMTNHDEKGDRIFIHFVYPVKDSDTVLAAPCKKTDTVLKVKDASKFKKGCFIAFNTKKDLSDLPNRSASSHTSIKNIEKKGDIWEVTITRPIKADHAANTPIRAHYNGWYQYLMCGDRLTPGADWKTYTFKVAGTKAGNPSKQWTLGTKGVRFIVFNNGKRSNKEIMYFRNLTITTPGK